MKVTVNVPSDEDGLKIAMRDVILKSRVCPETSAHLMYEMYRDAFELPVDAVYAQFTNT